jgi:tRNA(Ile)-lysidine synthase
MDLLNKVRQTISAQRMLQPGDRVIVALSGGIDSMTLLEALSELSDSLAISLAIAHLDHQMRPDSGQDAEFVRRVAQQRGLPVLIESINVPSYIAKQHCSPEAGARLMRYRFLERAAKQLKANVIALGHTRDDQIETFLMRLIRGSGTAGLSGIPAVRPPFIRPLIDCTRQEILAFAQKRRLAYREDPTNSQLDFLRNRVRHELLPLLTQYNPNIRSILWRTQQRQSQIDRYLESLAQNLLEKAIVQAQARNLLLDKRPFKGKPEILKLYALRVALRHVRGDLQGIDAIHLEALLAEFERRRSGAEIHLPSSWRGVNQGKNFLLSRAAGAAPQETPDAGEYPLGVPGETVLPEIGWRFQLRLTRSHGRAKRGRSLARPSQKDLGHHLEIDLDYAKIEEPLAVRRRCRGDRFHPLGMEGRKKLQDFFVDEKVPRAERDRIPLVVDRQGIVWVVGWRLSDAHKIAPETKQVLHITAEPLL